MRTIEAKIVVLGSQGVGKTSMVVRYIGKMFSHHISPTIGASFFTCKINVDDTRVKLQVWDTAGQERFRSMAPMYYRNANAALLVFDITQYHTFTAIKGWVKDGRETSGKESFWIKNIGTVKFFKSSSCIQPKLQRNVEEPIVLSLVGNKTDLVEQRKVTREEAQQYALAIGGSYFETSALQDEGIEEVFLNSAMGMIKLSEDNQCTTLRIYDSSETGNPNALLQPPLPLSAAVQLDKGPSQAEQERGLACC